MTESIKIKKQVKQKPLKIAYCENDDTNMIIEIGVDEAGRGPMLGRVYTGAVVLPKNMEQFNHALMKDSKKFHSDKKIHEVAIYIKEHAIAWSVAFSDENVIDDINIRRATHKAMHGSISETISKLNTNNSDILLLIDGNDFTTFSNEGNQLSHVCIEGGDNAYTSIAAASILAKVARDDYIAELCVNDPSLIERYDLLKNKGYGTQKHMDGIRKHGITLFHRKTFGICRDYV
jgi:ribonuclease HII